MDVLAESDCLLDRLIKSNFDRVARIATLTPTALADQGRDAPVLMSDFNIDDVNDYTFHDGPDLTLVDHASLPNQAALNLRTSFVDTYADFVKQETDCINENEVSYQNLLAHFFVRSRSPERLQSNKQTPLKRREAKHASKLTERSLGQLFHQQQKGCSPDRVSLLSDDVGDKQPSLKIRMNLSPITLTTSNASTDSHELAKKSFEADTVITMQGIQPAQGTPKKLSL
jgi:hypothetical protein